VIRALRRLHLIGGGAPEVRFGGGGGAPIWKVGVGGAKMKSAAAAFGGLCGLFLYLISLLIYENMQAELRKTF